MDEIPQRVLVVTPHPDDAELWCGGALARWIGQGAAVYYVLCTDGSRGCFPLFGNVPLLGENHVENLVVGEKQDDGGEVVGERVGGKDYANPTGIQAVMRFYGGGSAAIVVSPSANDDDVQEQGNEQDGRLGQVGNPVLPSGFGLHWAVFSSAKTSWAGTARLAGFSSCRSGQPTLLWRESGLWYVCQPAAVKTAITVCWNSVSLMWAAAVSAAGRAGVVKTSVVGAVWLLLTLF